MSWTVSYQESGKGVVSLTATFNAGQADEWRFTLSVDGGIVKDWTPYAAKIIELHELHVQESTKPSPYQPLADALADALNSHRG